MCRWKAIHAIRKCGHDLSKRMKDEPVPAQGIMVMRCAMADEQECQIVQNNNTTL